MGNAEGLRLDAKLEASNTLTTKSIKIDELGLKKLT